MLTKGLRKEMEKLLFDVFDRLDSTGNNTKKYKGVLYGS